MYSDGLFFRCAVKRRESSRRKYARDRDKVLARTNGRKQRLKDAGLCIECGKDVALGVRCFDCMRVNDESKSSI